MRISKLAATGIATALSGSLVLGVSGIAGATAHPPKHTAAVSAAAKDATPATAARIALYAKLGETLRLAAQLSQEAQAQKPDMAALKRLQSQIQTMGDELLASLRSSSTQSANESGGQAADAVSDLQTQLKKLIDDVTELLKAVAQPDLSKITSGVSTVLSDLETLLTTVPKLLAGLPLDQQDQQTSQTPQNPKSPENAQSPQSPQNTRDPQNAQDQQNARDPQAPQNARDPQSPQAPQSPQNAQDQQNARDPKSPQAPQNTENAQDPLSLVPQTPQDAQSPQSPDMSAIPQTAPQAPQAPQLTQAQDR